MKSRASCLPDTGTRRLRCSLEWLRLIACLLSATGRREICIRMPGNKGQLETSMDALFCVKLSSCMRRQIVETEHKPPPMFRIMYAVHSSISSASGYAVMYGRSPAAAGHGRSIVLVFHPDVRTGVSTINPS
jgi:hypothetical protein